MSSYLTDEGKNSLYLLKVIHGKTKSFIRKIGYAFIVEEFRDGQELLLVSSTSVLLDLEKSVSSDNEVHAERYCKPKLLSKDPKPKVLKIDPGKLSIQRSNSEEAISFVSNIGELNFPVGNSNEYKLRVSLCKDPVNNNHFKGEKDPLKAFVFRSKEIIEVLLEPDESETSLEVSGVESDIALEEIKGAPIVLKNRLAQNEKRSEVVGLIEYENETCYPVFFTKNTFKSACSGEYSGANLQVNGSGHRDSTDSSPTRSSGIKDKINGKSAEENDDNEKLDAACGVTTAAVQEERTSKTDPPLQPTPTPLVQTETSKQNSKIQAIDGVRESSLQNQEKPKIYQSSDSKEENIDPKLNGKSAEENDGDEKLDAACGVTTAAVQEERTPKRDPPLQPTAPPLVQTDTSKQNSKIQAIDGVRESSLQNQEKPKIDQSSGGEMVTGFGKIDPTGTTCIKSLKLESAPRGFKLFQDLSVLLDPHKPFGNDYRELADLFDCSNSVITYLESKKSPTHALFEQLGTHTTLEELYRKVKDMEKRDDVLEKMDEYFQKNCKHCINYIR